MINITALSSIYLLTLIAIAMGIKSLTDDECSDWLASCPAEVATMGLPHKDSRSDSPGALEYH